MAKRDLLSEILAKKQRGGGRYYVALSGLGDLEAAFSRREAVDDLAAAALYVVGIAACIESGVRDVIRRLIDHGPTYVNRIPDMLRTDMRFNLDIVAALRDRTISFGDFVAHLVTLSSLEHIVANLELLTGGSLRELLANVREPVEPPDAMWLGPEPGDIEEYERAKSAAPQIIIDVDALLADIAKLFATRHIVAHEANFRIIAPADAEVLAMSAKTFLRALDEHVEQTTHPDAPRSAFGTSIAAAIRTSEISSKLETALSELKDMVLQYVQFEPERAADALGATEESFAKYADDEVSFRLALHSLISGNAIRALEADVRYTLIAQRLDVVNEVTEIVKELFRDPYVRDPDA